MLQFVVMGNAYRNGCLALLIQDGKRDPFSGSKQISGKYSIRYGCVYYGSTCCQVVKRLLQN